MIPVSKIARYDIFRQGVHKTHYIFMQDNLLNSIGEAAFATLNTTQWQAKENSSILLDEAITVM